MQEADDFREESRALHALLAPLTDDRLQAPTQFKGWSINDVIQHLTVWNHMARLQIEDEAELERHFHTLLERGADLRKFETAFLDDLRGSALLEAWQSGFEATADTFAAADPKQRLKWVGPTMSARSSITARLMESWAHGQEVYDELGVERQNTDRIRGIVVLGVNTYRWAYMARGTEPPGEMPRLELTSPSGDIWIFGESETDRIAGLAEEFCQVVTQTRNIADTSLTVEGGVAEDWMAKAQCFAGPAIEPPAPGSRHRRENEN